MESRLKIDIGWAPLLWTLAGAPVSQRDAAGAAQVLEAYFEKTLVIGLSVRTLFDAILSELALPAGDCALMSGVNIKNMADVVQAHGLQIKACDIDPNTLAPPPGALVQAQEETKARVCVLAQLFGAVNEAPDASLLRERGVFVIEDAAQAFAGRFHRGAGNVDVSLFSFGPIKRRTALGGAIAAFRDSDLASRIRTRLEVQPKRTESWLRQRALKYVALKTLTNATIYGAIVNLLKAVGKDPDAAIGNSARGFSGTDLITAIRARPPDRMVVLMAKQITATRDPAERRQICEAFFASLPPEARPGVGVGKHAYWLLPIVTESPDRLIEHLRQKGFDATRGATSLRAVAREQTPAAQSLLEKIIYLPHPATLNTASRERLAQAVLAGIRGFS